jgi:hypothetical protein
MGVTTTGKYAYIFSVILEFAGVGLLQYGAMLLQEKLGAL